MAGSSDVSIAAALERAADAYESLAERAEAIEDEWQYIEDLRGAYGPAIRALAHSAGGPAVEDHASIAAIDELIAEIDLIEDAHKCIDWLSTFPHVVALAVGGSVDETLDSIDPGGAGGPTVDDAGDSPFGFLLGGKK